VIDLQFGNSGALVFDIPRAGYDGHKRKRGSKVHMAVDTLGLLLAVSKVPDTL
jgi:hypothetical protein